MNFLVQVNEDCNLPRFFEDLPIKLSKTTEKTNFSFSDNKLSYAFQSDNGGKDLLKIDFDFHQYFSHWHKVRPSKLKDNLGKCLGLKKGETLYDLSCGTGKDSSLFLYWEFKVVAYERNPVIYLLLSDALRRLVENPQFNKYADRIILNFGDSKEFLTEMRGKTVFFDPMFGALKKKNKAKARKEMEFFRSFVGPDEDALDQIHNLLENKSTVVLKRPDDSFDLGLTNKTVVLKWKGKTTEFWRLKLQN